MQRQNIYFTLFVGISLWNGSSIEFVTQSYYYYESLLLVQPWSLGWLPTLCLDDILFQEVEKRNVIYALFSNPLCEFSWTFEEFHGQILIYVSLTCSYDLRSSKAERNVVRAHRRYMFHSAKQISVIAWVFFSLQFMNMVIVDEKSSFIMLPTRFNCYVLITGRYMKNLEEDVGNC